MTAISDCGIVFRSRFEFQPGDQPGFFAAPVLEQVNVRFF